jgi:hypothetical protein
VARTHSRIYTSIWTDDDFRRLPKEAQRAYFMLVSQPAINNCGVLPYVPRKWAKLAADENEHALGDALADLADRRFIVLDEDTDELLIRTFIKHDRIREQPNLKTSATRQFTEIESRSIRWVLLDEYPDLFDSVATNDLREPLPDPLWKEVA